MDLSRDNFEMPLGRQNAQELLSGAHKPVDSFPTTAFPKQQGKVDLPGAGLAA